MLLFDLKTKQLKSLKEKPDFSLKIVNFFCQIMKIKLYEKKLYSCVFDILKLMYLRTI